jgi:hypothetical protein
VVFLLWGPSRSRVPPSAIESARRAVALRENQELGQGTTTAVPSEMLGEFAAVTGMADSEVADKHQFGHAHQCLHYSKLTTKWWPKP